MGKCIEGMLSNGDLIKVGIAKLCYPLGTSPCWSTFPLLGLHLRTCFCGQYSGAHTHTELLMRMQPHPAHTHTQCHTDIHTFPQRCTPTPTQCPTHTFQPHHTPPQNFLSIAGRWARSLVVTCLTLCRWWMMQMGLVDDAIETYPSHVHFIEGFWTDPCGSLWILVDQINPALQGPGPSRVLLPPLRSAPQHLLLWPIVWHSL